MHQREKIYFLDETGIQIFSRRNYGRSQSGTRANRTVSTIRSKNYSISAAMCTSCTTLIEFSSLNHILKPLHSFFHLDALLQQPFAELTGLWMCAHVCFTDKKQFESHVEQHNRQRRYSSEFVKTTYKYPVCDTSYIDLDALNNHLDLCLSRAENQPDANSKRFKYGV